MKITPDSAAVTLMARRGHVVVAFPGTADVSALTTPGFKLSLFGGGFLVNGHLEITKSTDRRDWDQQFRMLFPRRKDRNNHTEDTAYFRCRYIEDASMITGDPW